MKAASMKARQGLQKAPGGTNGPEAGGSKGATDPRTRRALADIALRTSEHAHAAALARWARMNEQRYPDLRHGFFHVPNGGARAKATAWSLHQEGVKPGVADYILLARRGPYGALAIELKNDHPRGVLSPAQREWLAAAEQAGYRVVVAFGWQAAVAEIENYMALPKLNPGDSRGEHVDQ